MFLLYPLYLLGSISATLTAYLISPFLALLVDKDGNLPRCLYYFQTFDTPTPQGYWEALKWLCRNPAYGFDLFLFGVSYDPVAWKIRYFSSTTLVATDNRGAFCVRYKSPYKYVPSVKFGWKLFNFLTDGKPVLFGMGGLNYGRLPFCFSIIKS